MFPCFKNMLQTPSTSHTPVPHLVRCERDAPPELRGFAVGPRTSAPRSEPRPGPAEQRRCWRDKPTTRLQAPQARRPRKT